jgi:hypothetical protein
MVFEFDPSKTFDENIADFRKHLEAINPESAKIFFDCLPTLLGDGNPARAPANRIAFNEAVMERLNILPAKTEVT